MSAGAITRKDSSTIRWSRPWWRHQMETFSASLAVCAGNSPVPGELPAQRPVTRSFDVFFDLRLNKRLSKQSRGWWFETPSRPLWRHRNAITYCAKISWPLRWIWTEPIQNDRHLGDAIFKWIILNRSYHILLEMSLKFVPDDLIYNKWTLVHLMASRRIDWTNADSILGRKYTSPGLNGLCRISRWVYITVSVLKWQNSSNARRHGNLHHKNWMRTPKAVMMKGAFMSW